MKLPKVKLTFTRPKRVADYGPVKDSATAAKYARLAYPKGTMDYRERFGLLLLSRANEVLGYEVIADGGQNLVAVDVKLIMQAALLSHAAAIVIFHNHPSGNLMSSQSDVDLTNRVKSACLIMGIVLMDSLILTSEGHKSFAEEGLI